MKKLLVIVIALSLSMVAFVSGADAQTIETNENEYVCVLAWQTKDTLFFENAIDDGIYIVAIPKDSGLINEPVLKGSMYKIQFDNVYDWEVISAKKIKGWH